MKTFFRVVSLFALCCAALCLTLSPAMAQKGGGRGTVTLKGASGSHGVRCSGTGQITLIGGYYVAPAAVCTVNVADIDPADGAQVQVTLEYVATANLAPVFVGTIDLSGGKGSLSTVGHPTPTAAGTPLATMTIRRMDGSVIMSGNIRGL